MSTDLLFCKGKVFVHVSKRSEENLAGFLVISKDPQQSILEATVSWIPEQELTGKQVDELSKADLRFAGGEGSFGKLKMSKDVVLQASYVAWGFSIRLGNIYSVQFRHPSPSGWWFGSIAIHSKIVQEQNSIPILFFHDDVCASTREKQKRLAQAFDPFSGSNDTYWGGDDFRDAMIRLVDFKQTLVDPSIWLVNATLEDLRNFASSGAKTTSNEVNETEDVSSSLWNKFDQIRWNLMSKFADLTTRSTDTVVDLISRHPVVKFVDKHSSSPYVRQIMTNPKVQEIQDDFDSAKIYLAKWALGVKEEAERYQTKHGLNDSYRRLLFSELGNDGENVELTEEEINIAMQRSHGLTTHKWESFFDSEGHLSITVEEVKDYVFHGGVKDLEIRKQLWLFLLGVVPWNSSASEREILIKTLREEYRANYRCKWEYRQAHADDEEEAYWHDQVLRIEKDVKRNDRDHPLYKYNTDDGRAPPESETMDDEDAVDDLWRIRNPHLNKLRSVLLSYNIHNNNLGYVQGMADLLSPIYAVLQDEELSFWCFVNFMERMERNFLRDQSGIRDQMLTLTDLCQLMLPKLSEHLNKCDSSNLFFCFRMLLVWFKREFSFDDVCSIWEIFWTDFYSSQFQLLFMLAILQKSSWPVMQNLTQFDQVLKYFNDLKGSMEWSDIMIRSELLFIKLRKLVEINDRRAELKEYTLVSRQGAATHEAAESPAEEETDECVLVTPRLRALLQKELVIQREGPRKKDSIR
ncbi:LAMI_0F14488g1_1 [Lachancea mirantina]|uniref:LAMI_0F14488g1_1 n=1 Tax=Lachancea mirantina TaxID=1230905 RepID=A0A1G4K3W3_9SACH|nr:LAMI_0F14488g1_1 [Lachancea mirantina]